MGQDRTLGDLERRVLMSVLKLDGDAYAASIGTALKSGHGKGISRGALYTTLDRLESKGFLTWRVDSTTPERGGLPRRAFRVTNSGKAALRAVHRELAEVVQDLDALFDRS